MFGAEAEVSLLLNFRSPLILLYGYRLITFSGGTFLRGVQGNPNYFPILVQGDAVDGMSPI